MSHQHIFYRAVCAKAREGASSKPVGKHSEKQGSAPRAAALTTISYWLKIIVLLIEAPQVAFPKLKSKIEIFSKVTSPFKTPPENATLGWSAQFVEGRSRVLQLHLYRLRAFRAFGRCLHSSRTEISGATPRCLCLWCAIEVCH